MHCTVFAFELHMRRLRYSQLHLSTASHRLADSTVPNPTIPSAAVSTGKPVAVSEAEGEAEANDSTVKLNFRSSFP